MMAPRMPFAYVAIAIVAICLVVVSIDLLWLQDMKVNRLRKTAVSTNKG